MEAPSVGCDTGMALLVEDAAARDEWLPPQSDFGGRAESSTAAETNDSGAVWFRDSSSTAAADCANAAASMPKMETGAGSLDEESVACVANGKCSRSSFGDVFESALPLNSTAMASAEDGTSAEA